MATLPGAGGALEALAPAVLNGLAGIVAGAILVHGIPFPGDGGALTCPGRRPPLSCCTRIAARHP